MLVAGCGASHSLKGSIRVIESLGLQQANAIGSSCTGLGGYDDLHAGTAVTVKDESGKVLATGQLGAGKITSLETCQWSFTITDVPDVKFYQVEVGHRGQVTYSLADLESAHWTIDLRLG